MNTEYDDKTYTCTNCFCELPSYKFYCSSAYPVKRDYHSNYCKDCLNIKNKEYNSGNLSSDIYKMNLMHSYELLQRIGYDVSDLENNSIHEQFMTKYEDVMSKPLKRVTDEEKKEKRRLYLKKLEMRKRT
jgi:hypothetical protein